MKWLVGSSSLTCLGGMAPGAAGWLLSPLPSLKSFTLGSQAKCHCQFLFGSFAENQNGKEKVFEVVEAHDY